MYTRFTSFLLCLALAACGGRTDEPASDDMMAEETPVADATMAPDASNPGGFPEGEVPPGWLTRFDDGSDHTVGTDPDSSDVYFVTMTPGWHVTTGPSGIYWHPANTSTGSYNLHAAIHLFNPGERNEGFGVFFGGSGLDGPDQAYTYFLLRRSGEFLVKRRSGEETEEIIGWTANDAIAAYADTTTGTVRNDFDVDVDGETVRFSVNGTEVATVPAADLETDGVVGLRLNHRLNVHVEDLSVEPGM